MRYRSIPVFCLGGWSPLLPTGFLVSRGTPDSVSSLLVFAYQAFTVFGLVSQQVRLTFQEAVTVLYPGGVSSSGLGFCPVRSPLLGVSRLISFPPATWMFRFTGFPSHTLWYG